MSRLIYWQRWGRPSPSRSNQSGFMPLAGFMMPWSQTFRFWRKSKSDSVNNSTSPLSRWLYSAIFSFILILYTGLSLYQIELPGLHYDEAFEAAPALQMLLGQ